jgi:hypothetical protein
MKFAFFLAGMTYLGILALITAMPPASPVDTQIILGGAGLTFLGFSAMAGDRRRR